MTIANVRRSLPFVRRLPARTEDKINEPEPPKIVLSFENILKLFFCFLAGVATALTLLHFLF